MAAVRFVAALVVLASSALATHPLSSLDAPGSPPPANMQAVECAFHTLAVSYGSSHFNAASSLLHDALNIDTLCPKGTIDEDTEHALRRASAAFEGRSASTAAIAHAASAPFETQLFVAPNGADSNPGTIGAPFATLAGAQTAVRAIPIPTRIAAGGVRVNIRAGTYYLNSTFTLDSSDSYCVYAGYQSEAVVLSGAKPVTGVSWAPYAAGPPGVLVANVSGLGLDRADPRLAAWMAGGRVGLAPPPLVNSLFVNGARAVRARYPNGNPADNSGICFSKTQRAGEGCKGYSTCTSGDGGAHTHPPGASSSISGITPNRGSSPAWGCPQCTQYGQFAYKIFPPPAGHPVYNKPIPGVGWANNSLFTFW